MYSFVLPRLCNLSKQITKIKDHNIRNFTFIPTCGQLELCKECNYNLLFYRSKSKNKKSNKRIDSGSEDEEEENWDEEIIDKNTKVLNVKVNSLRTDILLKMGLGMARNKVETLFYESKIRVNGKKIPKKSEVVNAGDEIDIVKGVNSTNPKLLVVARVEVLSVEEKEEKIGVKLRRTKSLVIENYEDPWKGNSTSL